MAKNLDHLLAGHWDIYWILWTSGSSTPVTDNAVDWTGWTPFGYQNEDGIKTSIGMELLKANVSDHNGPVKAELINEEALLQFMLLESDLLQMGLSIASATYTAGAAPGTNPNTLTFGDKTSLLFYTIGAEGVSKDGNEEIWVFNKCLANGKAEWQGQKKEWRGTPFEWECYNETTLAAGQRLVRAWEITSAP